MRYLIFIMLLSSCSHSLTLSPKGCYSNGFVKKLENKSYSIEKTIFSVGSIGNEYLKDILESKNIDCKKIKNINYTFKSDFADSLISILPFVESKTLVINYSLN